MVKKYVMDESKSWEDRYKELEAHHVAETTELVHKIGDLREEVAALEKRISIFDKWDYDEDSCE